MTVSVFVPRTESPIETAFIAALVPVLIARSEIAWLVTGQQRMGTYRLDFALRAFVLDRELRLAIECDGHAFHERTPEQAQRDKARDRDLLLLGWPTARYTGSEITRDPDRCAANAVEIVLSAVGLVQSDSRDEAAHHLWCAARAREWAAEWGELGDDDKRRALLASAHLHEQCALALRSTM